jgi:hypothetical protein
VVVILKAREPARIMIAIGDKLANRWHLQMAKRWVVRKRPANRAYYLGLAREKFAH